MAKISITKTNRIINIILNLIKEATPCLATPQGIWAKAKLTLDGNSTHPTVSSHPTPSNLTMASQ